MIQVGARPTSWVQVLCEMQRDWSRKETAGPFAEILFAVEGRWRRSLPARIMAGAQIVQILDLLAEDNRLISNDVGNVNVYAAAREVRPPGAPTMGGTSEQRGYEISGEADRRRT
jgi:hypothetical protein